MATELIGGIELEVDDEGFMTNPAQWTEELAPALGKEIGLDELTDEHWKVIRFLRSFEAQGETATLRRVSTLAGVPTKDLYRLFPKKPAKKMSYVAGLQKPTGCV
jgi:tRNA 2-thiouridine synthesizing protein E